MHYIDGFLLPLPRRKIEAYRKLSSNAGRAWREHGARAYRERVGHELGNKRGGSTTFPSRARSKRGETVVFSWIVYKSKAHLDRANKKVMKDPRLAAMMSGDTPMPFDMKRMADGGFRTIVDL